MLKKIKLIPKKVDEALIPSFTIPFIDTKKNIAVHFYSVILRGIYKSRVVSNNYTFNKCFMFTFRGIFKQKAS